MNTSKLLGWRLWKQAEVTSMTNLKWLTSASLALVMLPVLYAEPHCPGNVASIRPRFLAHSLIIVPVILNNSGPYDFVLNTANQITIVDPRLAAELHLASQGTTHVIGISTYTQASYAQVESLQTGAHAVKDMLLLISNLGQEQVTDPRIRGILGSNFLAHFDLLIDYAQGLVCLDDTKQMQEKVKGVHIEFVTPTPHPERNLSFTQPLVVPVRVSGFGERPLSLLLDSGSNAAILFNVQKQLLQWQSVSAPLTAPGPDGLVLAFAALQLQDIQVGPHSLQRISFITPVSSGKNDLMKPDVDGVLPTALFRRTFISYADHFVVLAP